MKIQNPFKKAKYSDASEPYARRFDAVRKDEPVYQSIQVEYRKQNMKRAFYIRLTIIFIILNLFLIFKSFGQLITVNNLNIANSTSIFTNGTIVSNAGTTISNDGLIELTGDFINNSGSGLFGSSAGTVVLTGTNQIIGGSSVTQFNNLELQSSGIIQLQNHIITGGDNGINSGVLSLGTNLLELNSFQLTINNAASSAISRTSGFIVSESNPAAGYGFIKWNVKNNTGDYIFPFGNSATGNYLPVTFDINSPGTGINGAVSVATYPTATSSIPNNRPLPNGLGSLINHAGVENAANVLDRWWIIDVSGYSDNPVSSLTFTYSESEWDGSAGSTNAIAENTLQAQSSNFSQWIPIPAGSLNTAANTFTISGLNTYNPVWTLYGNNSPLPVELLAFDARLNKTREVEINWVTAAEINNDYFTVEKSNDGLAFEAFAVVKGAGNSSNTNHYSSIDKVPFTGISYYRLKQTDFDGHYSYSDVKAVNIHQLSGTNVVIYPNPAEDYFYVKYDENVVDEKMILTDLNGKLIKEIPAFPNESSGQDYVKVDCTTTAPGMYFITTSGGHSQKIIIK